MGYDGVTSTTAVDMESEFETYLGDGIGRMS